MATVFTYSLANDFPNAKASFGRLQSEIRESAITIAVDSLELVGDVVTVTFKADISNDEVTILNGLVAVHTGEPLTAPTEVLLASPKNEETGVPKVAIAALDGEEYPWSTHNFCDPTTWFGDSVRVTEETLTDSGDGLTFTSIHETWIDVVSGRLDDDEWVQRDQEYFDPEHPHKYLVVVIVDDVEKTARAYGETTGGDYSIDFVDGKVTFFASQSGKTIKASYSYATTSTFYLVPYLDKPIDILTGLVQFTADLEAQDTMQYEVYGYVQVFAPELWDQNVPPGPYPTNTKIPLTMYKFKNLNQVFMQAICVGSIPAMGGARGTSQTLYWMDFGWQTSRYIDPASGMELRVSLEHHRPAIGTSMTATFKCIERSENTEVF